MLVAVGSSRAAVSHLLILTCLQTLVDTVNRCAENFILFFSPVTMCVFFGVFLIVCFVVSINKETFLMSNVRRYGLATGGIMRALLTESGLITCCDVFSWLYGTDVTFGLSQHERSTNVPRYHLLRSVTNPLVGFIVPLRDLTLNLPRSAPGPGGTREDTVTMKLLSFSGGLFLLLQNGSSGICALPA